MNLLELLVELDIKDYLKVKSMISSITGLDIL